MPNAEFAKLLVAQGYWLCTRCHPKPGETEWKIYTRGDKSECERCGAPRLLSDSEVSKTTSTETVAPQPQPNEGLTVNEPTREGSEAED